MMQDTSLDAYFEIQLKVGKMQRIVFEAIAHLGCPTDLEIARYLGFTDPNKVKPRRNELVKKNLVTECTKRNCFVSGRKAITWRVSA